MVRHATERAVPGGAPRFPLVVSLLLASLLLAHIALMATERHAPLPGAALGEHIGQATIGVASGAGHHLAAASAPGVPTTILGDCPARQAIPPLLLVILLALIAARRRFVPYPPARLLRVARVFVPPPPVPPNRRRTLLQVFLI